MVGVVIGGVIVGEGEFGDGEGEFGDVEIGFWDCCSKSQWKIN